MARYLNLAPKQTLPLQPCHLFASSSGQSSYCLACVSAVILESAQALIHASILICPGWWQQKDYRVHASGAGPDARSHQSTAQAALQQVAARLPLAPAAKPSAAAKVKLNSPQPSASVVPPLHAAVSSCRKNPICPVSAASSSGSDGARSVIPAEVDKSADSQDHSSQQGEAESSRTDALARLQVCLASYAPIGISYTVCQMWAGDAHREACTRAHCWQPWQLLFQPAAAAWHAGWNSGACKPL